MTTRYQGAFSRRRYSNLVSSGSGSGSTFTHEPYSGAQYVTLNAYAENPTMGKVSIEVVSDPVTNPNPSGGADFSAGTTLNYAKGTVVKLVARPNQGYRFVSWTHNLEGVRTQGNPKTITLTKNTEMRANFTPITVTYTLRVSWDGSMGKVTANGLQDGSMSSAPGSQVTLEATPKDGYVFKRWEGVNLAGNLQDNTSRRITITMPARDLNLTAVFAKAVENPGGGGGTPGGGTNDEPPTDEPVVIPAVYPNTTSSDGMLGKAMDCAKKWWWAIAILVWLYYDSKKGGSR